MNRISAKLTAYFFISVLIMEVSLIVYLHQSIIHSRIDEEFSRLLATGSNHRDVLVEYYSDTTMKHIVLMEKDSDREVVITNNQGDILHSSGENRSALVKYLPTENDMQLKNDKILASDWEGMPYIISAHPYKVDSSHSGYVIMFQNTRAIEQLVGKLNLHFGMAGVTSVVALFIIYAILSKFLTRPLIRMKEATEKLSKGDFNVSLPFIGNDELGELSGSIQKLADDLERLKMERNEFLASIAHELSTPLTYLIGYSKVAMRQGVNETDRNHYLSIIAEESDRMKELVKNLLDLARMDENIFTVSKEYFNARPFFEDIFKLVGPSFNMKKLSLDLTCEEDLEIHADPLRLEQIMLNLLDNALKYSTEKSVVKVKVSKSGDKSVISVTDFGIGIPSEEIEFIFENLYRVEKSRSRTSGGSGIGLAIVKELVEAHNGSIEVESSIGKGSTFTISI
ncbi:HAMP domain-containing histidine kinase [Sporosarcina sp. Marseille-Q4063]|uniref:HAMP domain-containing sensor histidine kinase n=1 Tax=Sporosarcina sp. Marseille-Q4063 TaxID=2810514 RepID=UPI001BAF6029|nr:HAMP domain-containing sensor histidine kinase [Sporosarcina sp. Marseille-Q4063]QUW23369.1 HAMP domain-containing histidine kinase [Sporosarcina sp. Marseille-Q4063]